MSRRFPNAPSPKRQRKHRRRKQADQDEALIRDTAGVFTCATETAHDFAWQCKDRLEEITTELVFNDLAHEIWATQPACAPDLTDALAAFAAERRRHQHALTQLHERLTALAADDGTSPHLHLDPVEQYCDLVRARLFPEKVTAQHQTSGSVALQPDGQISTDSDGQ